MLSRVAESLFWAGALPRARRERARLLDVNFHALLDGEVADRGASWQRLVAVLGDDRAYLEHHEDYTAESVTNWVLWHRGNAERGLELHRARARERPLGARADLGRDVGGDQQAASCSCAAAPAPGHGAALAVRRAAQLRAPRSRARPTRRWSTARRTSSSGSDCTWSGPRRRRASSARATRRSRSWTRTTRSVPRALGDLLRSCSAFEAYVRRHGTSFEPVPVAEELVRSPDSPRSVRHCRRQLPRRGRADRRATTAARDGCSGGCAAELEFDEPIDVPGPDGRRRDGAAAGRGSTRSARPSPRPISRARAVPIAAITAQEVQQQQCG